MDDVIGVVFSGGPVNWQIMAIRDCLEYRVVVMPEIDWSTMADDPTGLPDIKHAVYRRTPYYDLDCHKIFEFVGVY